MIDRWLDQPDWIIVGSLLVGYGLTAYLCVAISFLQRWRPVVTTFQGIVGPFFVPITGLFALMVAFLGNGAHETLRDASSAVLRERDGAVEIMQIARALPPDSPAARLTGLTRDYLRSVVDSEWELPRGHIGSPETEAAMQRLRAVAIDPAIERQFGAALQRELIDAVAEIGRGRLARLAVSNAVTDELRWIGVLLIGVLSQMAIAAVHLEKRRPQVLALVLATLAAAASLGVIAMSERPFLGLYAMPPTPLQQLLQ